MIGMSWTVCRSSCIESFDLDNVLQYAKWNMTENWNFYHRFHILFPFSKYNKSKSLISFENCSTNFRGTKMKSVISVQSAAIRIVDTSCSSGTVSAGRRRWLSKYISLCSSSLQHCSTAECGYVVSVVRRCRQYNIVTIEALPRPPRPALMWHLTFGPARDCYYW